MILNLSAQIPGNFPGGGDLLKAVRQALKETMKQAKKDSAQGIKQRYVKPTLGTRKLKMRTAGLIGTLFSQGQVQSATKFIVKPRRRVKRLPQGTFLQAVKGQGGYLPRSFIGEGKLNLQLYQRESKSKLPIKKINTVSEPGMFMAAAERFAVGKKIERNFGAFLNKAFSI